MAGMSDLVTVPELWSIRAISMLLFVVIISYLYSKDKDKRKLMFVLGGGLAAYDLISNAFYSWIGIQTTGQSLSWFSIPLAFAVLLAAISSLLKWERFNIPFKAFLCVLGTSISMLVIKETLSFRIPNEPIYGTIIASSYTVLVYLVIKRREIPDVMFLLAQICYMSAEIGVASEMPEFTILASIFSLAFTVLVFVTSRYGTKEGVASVFSLQSKLQKTEEQLKMAQEQLIKVERLAAIGELAAMVGHDLRNPLTGIAGAAYYLKHKNNTILDAKSKEMLEIIEKNIECSNKIINDLLEYSREIRLELSEKNPRSLVEESLHQIEIPTNVQIVNLTENEPIVKVDAQKVQRIFLNIIRNAIDAMPEGGTLTIKSKEAKSNVQIAFTDTGVGMSEGTLKKIWTPLFTTKSKGMGLGLPICRRFIEAHGGKISVESIVGKGTTFKIAIPLDHGSVENEVGEVRLPESLSIFEK